METAPFSCFILALNGDYNAARVAALMEFIVTVTAFRSIREMAGVTGLEPATSGVTGRRSNQSELHPQRFHEVWFRVLHALMSVKVCVAYIANTKGLCH